MEAEKRPLVSSGTRPERKVIDSEGKQHNVGSFRNITGLTKFFGVSYTAAVIVYYASCSSTMLVINKVAVSYLPTPSFILLAQLLISALATQFFAKIGWMEVDALEWSKVKRFIWVVAGFLGTLYANIKVLQNSNVETFITFRSSTPLILSLLDWLFLGRTLPSVRSWLCLLALLAGSLAYVLVDTAFKLEAYMWLGTWLVFFVFDCVYVKYMCENVKMTNWGRVYYTNVMAAVPMLIAVPLSGEPTVLTSTQWDVTTIAPLLLSCVVGLCMSHASYLLRDAVSATAFTIVGILCKIITVIINCSIWENHANSLGMACLFLCVFAGTLYQQAPKRSEI